MSWKYEQRTGFMRDPSGGLVGVGYSGFGEWKWPKPAEQPGTTVLVGDPRIDQQVKSRGPIPCGLYTISELYKENAGHGPDFLHLYPAATNRMFGRDGFLIHGDSVAHPGQASEGCIILPHPVRLEIAASQDKLLEVM